MRENPLSISTWATDTFGPVNSNIRIAARANEEMAELLRWLSVQDNHPKAVEEAADVVIILMRLCHGLGWNLLDAVDNKMVINRRRKWVSDGSGHGYHVQAARGDQALMEGK